MLIMPSFKKSLIVEQFQGNYLKCTRIIVAVWKGHYYKQIKVGNES